VAKRPFMVRLRSFTEHRKLSLGLSNSIRNICEKDKKIKPPLLLNNLSGIAQPGEILAIMGTSGVGMSFSFKKK